MNYVFLILSLFLVIRCGSSVVEPRADLTGEWFVKEVFLGDVIDTPCGYELAESPQLTIDFSDEKNESGKLSFSGKAAINQFFGTYEIISYNEATGTGTISFGQIGATKKGGSEELMACEGRFFDLLNRTTDFSIINENGKDVLRIGVFKKDDKPSRDGGTFLIMGRL